MGAVENHKEVGIRKGATHCGLHEDGAFERVKDQLAISLAKPGKGVCVLC